MALVAPLKAVFFDMDGTIVDTESAAVDALRAFFQHYGQVLHPEDEYAAVGKKWDVAFDLLYAKHKWPMSRAAFGSEVLKKYRAILADDLPEIAGSRKAIESLAARWPLALVSGSSQQDILFCLDRLNVRHHFQLILGSEDYVQSKPSPEGYALALKELSVEPDSVVVFEDSEAGIDSAKAAGIKVVAITGTKMGQLETSRADARIRDFQGADPTWMERLWLALHAKRS